MICCEEIDGRSFLLGQHAFDGIAGIENQTELQGKVLGALEVAEAGHRRLVIEDADLIRGKVLHHAALLIGYGELQPDLGNVAAKGISRSACRKVVAGFRQARE